MTAQAAPNLGHLPEWNLADLYAAPDAPAFAADMKKGEALSRAFAEEYRGKLAGLGGAVRAPGPRPHATAPRGAHRHRGAGRG